MSNSYIPKKLRDAVYERAGNCCEYCLVPQLPVMYHFHVDHIIAEQHDGKTELDNLCLSCSICNSAKGPNIAARDPLTRQLVRLFHPVEDIWADYFRIFEERIEGMNLIGEMTVKLLQFNSTEQLKRRKLLLDLNVYPCTKA